MNNYMEFCDYVDAKHAGQKYNGEAYTVHLKAAEQVAMDYLSMHPSIVKIKLACRGHDLFEDTDATEEEVEKLLTGDIIHILKLLTDKPGKNRKERHLNTYYLIRENEIAVIVKLCDRISHLRQSEIKGCYLKEKDTFKFALYDPRHSYARILWDVYDSMFKKEKK